MFFTKYILDSDNSSVIQSFNNEYDMHRNVQSLFDSNRQSNNVLYRRVDNNLYVYSDIKPINTHEGFEWKGTKKLNIPMSNDSKFRFNVVAYPAVKKAVEGKKNSVRTCVRGTANKMDWFKAMAERNGFSPVEFDITNLDMVSMQKGNSSTNFIPCLFTGTLKVTEVEKFKKAFEQGIGSEKAFGCGMMLLMPTR